MASLTIGKMRPQRDQFQLDGVQMSDLEFLETRSKQADDVIHFKRLIVDLQGHHGGRVSELALIISLRADLCTLSAPVGSCVGASVAARMIFNLVQRCHVDLSGGHLLPRVFNELSKKKPDVLIFATDNAHRLAAILHDARENGGISEDGYFIHGEQSPQYW